MVRMTVMLACSAGLSACAVLGPASGGASDEMLKAINAHLDTCERHYQGGLGVGAAFTFRIDCPAAEARARREGDPGSGHD